VSAYGREQKKVPADGLMVIFAVFYFVDDFLDAFVPAFYGVYGAFVTVPAYLGDVIVCYGIHVSVSFIG
jgi:hypothetical protein